MTDTAEIAALRTTVTTLRETEEKLLAEIADVHNKDSGPPSQVVRRRLESLKAQADMVQHRRDSAERRLESARSEALAESMRAESRRATQQAIFVQILTALAAIASALAAWAAHHP